MNQQNFKQNTMKKRLQVCACGCEKSVGEALALGEQGADSCTGCRAPLDYLAVLRDYVNANWRPFTRLHRFASAQR